MRPICSRRPWRLPAAVMFAALLCCGQEETPRPSALSPDERYLVDAYVRVRRAGAFHPYQREIADSLLDRLAGEVDTLRVARAISSLNATPERWTVILETIERELGAQPSESTRG